ncbi:MAG TPA: hypothetical protein VFC26_11250, partial [Verrucomicrobiae bacterium]|nr:hypothetical protein [Verrucomicrobiae bacterium]
ENQDWCLERLAGFGSPETGEYDKLMRVSAEQIMGELPRLTEAERRAIRLKLLELAERDEDVRACNQAALEGAVLLDRMENEDAGRKPR